MSLPFGSFGNAKGTPKWIRSIDLRGLHPAAEGSDDVASAKEPVALIIGQGKQKSSNVSTMIANILQSSISKSLFESVVSQTAIQSVSIKNVTCGGDLNLTSVNQCSDLGSNMQAQSVVQQTTTQDGRLTQSLTQLAMNMQSGLTLNSNNQNAKNKQTQILQGSQYTEQESVNRCATDQNVQQIFNFENVTVGGDCNLGDIDQCTKMTAFQGCNSNIAQDAAQTFVGEQEASQTASNRIVGLSMMWIFLLIMVILIGMFLFAKTALSNAPMILIVIGGIVLVFAVIMLITGEIRKPGKPKILGIFAKGEGPVAPVAPVDPALATVLEQIEAAQEAKSFGFYWWWPTVKAPYGFVYDEETDAVLHIFSNKTFSQYFSRDPNVRQRVLTFGDDASDPFSYQAKAGYLRNWFDSTIDDIDPNGSRQVVGGQTKGCYDSGEGATSLRYVYTSYDFGGPEVVRCGNAQGRCANPFQRAGALLAGDTLAAEESQDTTDSNGIPLPSPESGEYTGDGRWRNHVIGEAWDLFKERGWCRDFTKETTDINGSTPGVLQQATWGAITEDRFKRPSNPDDVNDTLTKVLPFLKHHIANDLDDATNFDCVVFVAPYGSDHVRSKAASTAVNAWERLGYTRDSATPHFWYILCFKMENFETKFDTCLESLGGTSAQLPEYYEKCLNCEANLDNPNNPEEFQNCCDEFRAVSSDLYWYEGNLENRFVTDDAIENAESAAVDRGVTFLQANVVAMLSGDNVENLMEVQYDYGSAGASTGDQLMLRLKEDLPASTGGDIFLGGYQLPRCNSAVASNVPTCGRTFGALPTDGDLAYSSNYCCRNIGCPTTDNTELLTRPYDPADPEQNFKTNPGCWKNGTVPCVGIPRGLWYNSPGFTSGAYGNNLNILDAPDGDYINFMRDSGYPHADVFNINRTSSPAVRESGAEVATPRLEGDDFDMLPFCKDVNPFGVGAATNDAVRLNVLDIYTQDSEETPAEFWPGDCDFATLGALSAPVAGDLIFSKNGMADGIGGYATTGIANLNPPNTNSHFFANMQSEAALRQFVAPSNDGLVGPTVKTLYRGFHDKGYFNFDGNDGGDKSSGCMAPPGGSSRIQLMPIEETQSCVTANYSKSANHLAFENAGNVASNSGTYDDFAFDYATGQSGGLQILDLGGATLAATDNPTQHCTTSSGIEKLGIGAANKTTTTRGDKDVPVSTCTFSNHQDYLNSTDLQYCPGVILSGTTDGREYTSSAPLFNVCGLKDIPGIDPAVFYLDGNPENTDPANCACEAKSQFEDWEQASAVMCGGKYHVNAQGQTTGVGLAQHARPLNIEALRHKTTDDPPVLAMPYQDARDKGNALLQLAEPFTVTSEGSSPDAYFQSLFKQDEAGTEPFEADYDGTLRDTVYQDRFVIDCIRRELAAKKNPISLRSGYRKARNTWKRKASGSVFCTHRQAFTAGAAIAGTAYAGPVGGAAAYVAVDQTANTLCKGINAKKVCIPGIEVPFINYSMTSSYCDAAEQSLNDGYPIGPLCRNPEFDEDGSFVKETIATATDSAVINAKYNSSANGTFCMDAGFDATSTDDWNTGGTLRAGSAWCAADANDGIRNREWSNLHPATLYGSDGVNVEAMRSNFNDEDTNVNPGCNFIGHEIQDPDDDDEDAKLLCGAPAIANNDLRGMGVPLYKAQRSATDVTDATADAAGNLPSAAKISHLFAACKCPLGCDDGGENNRVDLSLDSATALSPNQQWCVPTICFVFQRSEYTLDQIGRSAATNLFNDEKKSKTANRATGSVTLAVAAAMIATGIAAKAKGGGKK